MTSSTLAASGTPMAIGDAAIAAILGYTVIFVGIAMLLVVISLVGKIMVSRQKKQEAEAPAVAQPCPAKAPGSAGEIKLNGVEPRTAAMIMAIVADKTGKPLNELRFKSIKEIKD